MTYHVYPVTCSSLAIQFATAGPLSVIDWFQSLRGYFHFGRYIVGYTVGNLAQRTSGAVKFDSQPYIQ